jgi:hypothetical protein
MYHMPFADPRRRREYHREYMRKWVAAHYEERLAYQRDYRRNRYQVDPEWKGRLQKHCRASRKKYGKQWAAAQRQRLRSDPLYKAKLNKYDRERTRKQKAKIIAALGGYCVKCGNTDPRVLEIDHIHGNGNQERRTKWPTGVIKEVLLTRDHCKFQLLCANCHTIKHSPYHDPSELLASVQLELVSVRQLDIQD